MDNIETKIICMETIKPSSPTPKPLQKHHLSSIDQSIPPIFNPLVYFHSSNSKILNSDKSKRLKKSLSEVLSRFYPLAGTLAGNRYVDCNDGGAPFFEAEANCDLSDVVFPSRNHEIMEKFLPYKGEGRRDLCLAVQTTFFRCGGVALGIIMSHKIADGLSTFMFANAWAAAAAGTGADPVVPKFDAAAYFPPLQETSGPGHAAGLVEKREELATTRIFTFPAAAVSLLRERYTSGGLRPSRVEALSAFIWTRFASATNAGSDPSKIHTVCHAINLRNRVDPPLSKYHFGNIVDVSAAAVAAKDGGAEVVRKIRDAVKAANGGYTARVDVDENRSVPFNFSSLCGYHLYEADFGWGKPVWVGLGRFPVKNTVYFTDTKSGGGIEALVHLNKQDMDKFEAHLELQIIKSKL